MANIAKVHIQSGNSLKFTNAIVGNLDNQTKTTTTTNLYGKQVLPYEYINSLQKLEEKCLTLREAFYSELNESHITNEDYIHAPEVRKIFKCKNIKDFFCPYLKTDCGLLADTFTSWRRTVQRQYEVDVTNYVSPPSFILGLLRLK